MLPVVTVNWIAILVAAIAWMIIGFLWFGPIFGKAWMKGMGAKMPSKMPKGMEKNYIIAFIGALITMYVFSWAIHAMSIMDAGTVLTFAFFTWLGFFATTALGGVLWEGKSWTWYAINTLYYLVSLGIAGIILITWY